MQFIKEISWSAYLTWSLLMLFIVYIYIFIKLKSFKLDLSSSKEKDVNRKKHPLPSPPSSNADSFIAPVSENFVDGEQKSPFQIALEKKSLKEVEEKVEDSQPEFTESQLQKLNEQFNS